MEITSSTIEEYKRAEQWIDSVIDKMDQTWTDIQKVAYIDHAIGRRMSYTANFDTEEFEMLGSRALWHMVDVGEGVCNRNCKLREIYA